MKPLLVIGGANVDILAKSTAPLRAQDSNIGTIRRYHGGVGRNVAENLARLGLPVTFLTAFSLDADGCAMREELEKLGVTVLSPATTHASASYVAIESPDGDMALAVADTAIMDDLTDAFIDAQQETFSRAGYLVFDANLSIETLRHLFASNPGRLIAMDAISTEKAHRVTPFLSSLALFKGNLQEGKELAGTSDPHEIISFFLAHGVKNVVISTGSGPIHYGSKDVMATEVVSPLSTVVSTTGAGDALFAGIVSSLSRGESLAQGVKNGAAIARHTLAFPCAVARDLGEWIHSHHDLS